MLSSAFLIVAIAAMSAAQSVASSSTAAAPSGPVVSLFLPDTDPQKLVASVIGSSGVLTTYAIACPASVDPSDCGYGGGITVTEGASSLRLSQVVQDLTVSVDCTLTGKTAGICVESYGGSAANAPGTTTTTLSASDITFFPVTVTAGLLAGSTGAAATTGTASETGAAPSSTLLGGTAQPTSGSAAASSSSPSSSLGAATSSSASSGGVASAWNFSWMGLGLFTLAVGRLQ